jgi:hypothetical protein
MGMRKAGRSEEVPSYLPSVVAGQDPMKPVHRMGRSGVGTKERKDKV